MTSTAAGLAPEVRRVASEVHAGLVRAPGTVGSAAPSGPPVPLRELVLAAAPLLGDDDVAAAVELVRALSSGLGVLEALRADDEVTEIMVNGDGSVWVERSGHVERRPEHLAPDEVLTLIERVAGPLGIHADRMHPIIDARLPDGSRVHAVIPPLAVDGPCLTVRRFRARTVRLLELAGDPELAALLRGAVVAKRNLLVSGGTSAGKTTLVNALAGCFGPHERIVTIEDTAELRLPVEHVVRLEARPAVADGIGEVPIADLVRGALRMRPDRIVVGEVRGAEALAMLQAMNTGHEGSMTTCHANAPIDALRRVETMAVGAGVLPLAAVREQVRSAVDLVVQVRRCASGARRVVAVDEVDAAGDGGAPLRTRHLVVDGRVVDEPTDRRRA